MRKLSIGFIFASTLLCCSLPSCIKNTEDPHCAMLYYVSAPPYYFSNTPHEYGSLNVSKFGSPSFNPLNSNQIVFPVYKTGVDSTKITVLNINSGLKTIFSVHGQLTGPAEKISWGQNNKLLLPSYYYYYPSNSYYSSYSVNAAEANADGTGMGTLFTGLSGAGIWSNNSSKILWSSSPSSLGIYSLNGQAIDSISLYYVNDFDWGVNGQIVVANNYKFLNIYDSTLALIKRLRIIADNYQFSFAFSVAWVPNSSKVIWSSIYGIYITDINTEKTTQFKTADLKTVYKGLSISPDGSTLAVYKEIWNSCNTDLNYFPSNNSGNNTEEGAVIELINMGTGAEIQVYP